MTMQDTQLGLVDGPVVLTGTTAGYAVVPVPTPLTFLNYYDGKFLRASDLDQEQLAQRALVRLSNVAGGAGVVYGFDAALGSGDALSVSAGLAVAPTGDVLYLPQAVTVSVSALLASMTSGPTGGSGSSPSASGAFAPCAPMVAPPTVPPTQGSDLYLITLGLVEGLCGTDEVFGRLCDAACTTATDRPWRIDGVVIGLVPLTLVSPLESSTAVTLGPLHLRSRVASAYFADEEAAAGSLISGLGLRSSTWCAGAAALGGSTVALGVLARSGGTTLFVDEWTARRERMETSPRRYWAGHMAMRPWDVLLAQILQFQCQLRDVLANAPSPGNGPDPCAQAVDLLGQSTDLIAQITAAQPTPDPPTPAPPPPAPPPPSPTPAMRTVAEAPAQKSAAKKSAAKKSAAKKSAPAKKAPSKKSAAKKSVAKKSVAKKSAPANKARRVVRAAAANPRVSAHVDPPDEQAGGPSSTAERTLERPADAELIISHVLTEAIDKYRLNVAAVLAGEAAASDRILVDGGIVELPPAGYLPIDLTGVVDLPTQVQKLLGPGLDLRFCTMRHDQAGFEVRKAQDLDRISMLVGIDDPTAKPQVDILVPDGTWSTPSSPTPGPTPAPGPTPKPDATAGGMAVGRARPGADLPIWRHPTPEQPTDPTDPTTATITPTLDWVLFRRRSDLDCGAITPVTPPVVVTVWDFQAPTQQAAGNDWKFLTTEPLEVKRMHWTQVGQATFTAGTADLLTTAAQIADWDTTDVGPHLAGAGYAASSGTDPQGVARAQAVANALGLAAFKGLTAGFADLSAQAPPSGSDADLYLITYPDATPDPCFEVWVLGRADSEKLGQAIAQGNVDAATDVQDVTPVHIDVVDGTPDADQVKEVVWPEAYHLVGWATPSWGQTGTNLDDARRWMTAVGREDLNLLTVNFDPTGCPARLWVIWNT
jgi:hypothetical protein